MDNKNKQPEQKIKPAGNVPSKDVSEEHKKQKSHINPLVIYSTLVAMFVIINVLFLSFTRGRVKTIRHLKEEVITLKQDEQIINSSQDISRRYSNQIDQIASVFPSEETFPDFLKVLETMIRDVSEEYNLRFTTTQPIREKDKLIIPFTIILRSDLPKFLVFLDNLERLPFMTHITSIRVTNLENYNGLGEYNVEAKVYVKNPFN